MSRRRVTYRSYARMSSAQHQYAAFVARHPGCCIADVDRACRRNKDAGHQWVYDGVKRLVRNGVLRTAPGPGGRVLLYVSNL